MVHSGVKKQDSNLQAPTPKQAFLLNFSVTIHMDVHNQVIDNELCEMQCMYAKPMQTKESNYWSESNNQLVHCALFKAVAT